ncbi:hypothetical protein DERP_002445 [Dermatophagoides pteronyssinus]|uniref:Uncharacterized protein n=1 Tax=Dermatophagoides pteronyssinus TaxID=6956 RepID=A0ABQ8JHR2_DERPT|nr:hypothetical protein DERP_002445 [Dermatophagoides pteronyssinus]
MISKTQSKSKPTESQTEEVSSQAKQQPITSSVVNEKQSTLKPENDQTIKFSTNDSSIEKKPENLSLIDEQENKLQPEENRFDDQGRPKIEESDNKFRKKEDSLKNSTHGGSQTTENQSTKIFRSNSYKDKKTQTPVSVIRRTQSKSKPTESQTEEVSSQAKQQPITSSVVNDKQSTLKPENDQTIKFSTNDSSIEKKPENLSLIDEQEYKLQPEENRFDDQGRPKIEESDNKLIKKEDSLKNLTHGGSQTTENQSTKIFRSNSYKDKKTQTLVSVIRRTQSTSKPQESQTNENLKEAWHEFKKQQTPASVLSEQSSLSKPAVDRGDMIAASDSSQVEKQENLSFPSTSKPQESQTNENLKEVWSQFKKQSITSNVVTNIEQSTSKPTESQTTKILSSESLIEKNPENLSLIDEQQPEEKQTTGILKGSIEMVTGGSFKDEKTLTTTTSSVVNEKQSKLEEVVTKNEQTEENRLNDDQMNEEISTKDQNQQNLAKEKPKTLKSENDQATNISSRDSFKEEKAESQTEEQSILEPENDQATKISSRYSFSFVGKKAENLSDEQSTLKPENDQATRISSRYSFSFVGKKADNLSEEQSTLKPENDQATRISSKDSFIGKKLENLGIEELRFSEKNKKTNLEKECLYDEMEIRLDNKEKILNQLENNWSNLNMNEKNEIKKHRQQISDDRIFIVNKRNELKNIKNNMKETMINKFINEKKEKEKIFKEKIGDITNRIITVDNLNGKFLKLNNNDEFIMFVEQITAETIRRETILVRKENELGLKENILNEQERLFANNDNNNMAEINKINEERQKILNERRFIEHKWKELKDVTKLMNDKRNYGYKIKKQNEINQLMSIEQQENQLKMNINNLNRKKENLNDKELQLDKLDANYNINNLKDKIKLNEIERKNILQEKINIAKEKRKLQEQLQTIKMKKQQILLERRNRINEQLKILQQDEEQLQRYRIVLNVKEIKLNEKESKYEEIVKKIYLKQIYFNNNEMYQIEEEKNRIIQGRILIKNEREKFEQIQKSIDMKRQQILQERNNLDETQQQQGRPKREANEENGNEKFYESEKKKSVKNLLKLIKDKFLKRRKKSSNGTKSANLSKQTIADDQSIQQPTNNHTSEPNIEITKSFNLDSSLTKRLQKSMKQTILSTATTQQMSGHQFLDYTKQF